MPPQLGKTLPGVSTITASRRGSVIDPGTCRPDKRLPGAVEATVTICTGCTGGLSVRARADDIRRTTGSGIAGSSMDSLAVSWLVGLVSCMIVLWPTIRASLNWRQTSEGILACSSDGLRSSPGLGCSLGCHGRCSPSLAPENRGCGISLDARGCRLACSSRWLLLEAAS